MKLWTLTTLLTVSLLIFSGCAGTAPKPDEQSSVDSTLPVVTLTENGVFVDMQAVAFEWNSIKDPRVKGIYVYKQILGSDETEHKYFDTVQSRFVTHYVDEEVRPESQYSYYFKTFSKDAESEPSQARVVSTIPALESVSWIHAIQNMPRSAKIIWRPHTNQIVKSYILERRTLSEDKWSKLATIKGRLNAEYIDEDLKDNFVYKYRIRVLTYNDITSNPSKEVSVVTKALPKQVENITATKDLPKKIKLTWAMSGESDFSHFNVYRSKSIDGSYKLITSTKINEFIDEIEEDGKNYFYRVSSVDKDALESENEVKSVHGKTLDRPITPSLVEVKMVGDNLEIRWSSTDQRAKTFTVKKSSKKSWFEKTSEEFVGIKGNSFIDKAIEPNTTYLYEVYSVDEYSIKSEPSIEVMFTTTETQGKVIEPKEDTMQKVDVIKAPQESNTREVVKPVEDFEMSEI